MNKTKFLQLGALAVAAIWVSCISFLLASGKLKKQETTSPQQSISITETTAESSTSESTATQPKITMDGNQVATNVSVSTPQWVIDESNSKQASEAASVAQSQRESSKEAAKDSVPKTKQEVIAAYVEAVNKLKNTSAFTMVKSDLLSVEIDDITGGSTIQNMASSMIESNTKTEPVTYVFSGGMDASTGKSPTAAIAPLGENAALDRSVVTDASAKQNSSGGYSLTIRLGEAVQTLDSPAEGYSTSMEVINVDSLGLPSSATITSLNITYNNSVIEAQTDKNGRITSMKHTLIVSQADGEGKMMMVPITVSLHGSYVSTYTINY